MDVTIALMVTGRVKIAPGLLDQLAGLAVPDGSAAEILVVGLHDAGAWRGAYKLSMRFVPTSDMSLTAMQRLVVSEARGRLIIWIGEDVVPEPGWLRAYRDAFEQHPDASVFAGKIVPQLAGATPSWFADARPLLQFPLGVRDFGPFRLPLFAEEGVVPFAANYAIRREAALRLLDDHERSVAATEASEADLLSLVTSAIDCGYPGHWLPEAVVHRPIDPAQQTTKAVFDYYRAAGAAAARQFETDRSPRVGNVPRWLLRRTAEGAARYHRDRVSAPPIRWVRSLIDYAADRGAVDHLRRRRRAQR